MFEVTGTDIGSLTDGDLRTLVARLALSELRAQGAPLSSVTAGGNQDAADGGIDVRVECPVPLSGPDFVPRALTGFQVKKPDMPAGAILKEMRPTNSLRPAIADLAGASGAYIIVSAQGSVADKPLADRRAAMTSALKDLSTAGQLHTDFYDRDRLATWVNEYPGVVAWVRNRVGRGTSGWSSIGDWIGVDVAGETPYLFNNMACVVDERSNEREALTIGEAIARLRTTLRSPQHSVRLIGLSGLGKTRLVQALFETRVGEDPLDPAMVVYTDYSVETDPTARDMARQLVASGRRAILIVDNCNPSTHGELARICSDSASHVSLLTVEYDVRDDEPERTEVFRLQAAAPDLVATWLKSQFPHISPVDRDKIAEFSDGNFRVARAVADTLARGQTLGKLKSRDLFERIFHQRNERDRSLQLAAEDLSLLYSVNGEDTGVDSELAIIAAVRGARASDFYAALVELGRRGVVQARGRWRAILPHAIANPLASLALERLPPADLDRLAASLTPRMLISLSRRLGFLHDVTQAKAAVARWLRRDGPLGDILSDDETGIQILANLAPVSPQVVLAKIEDQLDGETGHALLALEAKSRWRWISLIKALAYDVAAFEPAAMLLARFVAVEPEDHNDNSARDPFGELFQLHLSGTRATPAQRRDLVERLARSGDAGLQRTSLIAMNSLLCADHFSATGAFDFGARSRDWGWQPETRDQTRDWYDRAINLVVALTPVLNNARAVLSQHVRELLYHGGSYEALDRAASVLVGQAPWIEGWMAFRTALRFDGSDMDEHARAMVEAIIRRLDPPDLLHQARAVVLNRASSGWDVIDCEAEDDDMRSSWEKASDLARDIGRRLAGDDATRRLFVAELLVAQDPLRAFECGEGLAEGTEALQPLWQEITQAFRDADPQSRSPRLLGGLIYTAGQQDRAFANRMLDGAVDDPALAPQLPYLQGRVAIDEKGIDRLRRAILSGNLTAFAFSSLANGGIAQAPPQALAALLYDIAAMAGGVGVALDILHMSFYRDNRDEKQPDAGLVAAGRVLLARADFREAGMGRNHGLPTVIQLCCSGAAGEACARAVCALVRQALETSRLTTHDIGQVLKALFKAQPLIALDIFLLPGTAFKDRRIFEADLGYGTPVDGMDPAAVRVWAGRDPALRYPLLGRAIGMFKRSQTNRDNDIAPLFLETLAHAPDKRAFLGEFWMRVHPRGWSGSLAEILAHRKGQLLELADGNDADVRQWVAEALIVIDSWIERESGREREGEESFE